MTMIKHFISLFAATILLAAISLRASGQVPAVVTSKWLKDNLEKPDLVVLHVSTVIREYQNGHIPGAVFLWPGWLSVSNENESTVQAEPVHICKVLERLGVSNESHIVLCGIYGNLVPVCRVFVMLEHIGMAGRISILQGGFEEWKESGGQVSVENSSSVRGKLKINVLDNLVNGDRVSENLTKKDYFIIDARARTYYDGSSGISRKGHIPGSKNLPSTDCYDGKTFHFLSKEKLKDIFDSMEIRAGTRLVFYCNTGNSACIDYVAARIAGLDPVLYDGSMEEWGSRLDLPVEK